MFDLSGLLDVAQQLGLAPTSQPQNPNNFYTRPRPQQSDAQPPSRTLSGLGDMRDSTAQRIQGGDDAQQQQYAQAADSAPAPYVPDANAGLAHIPDTRQSQPQLPQPDAQVTNMNAARMAQAGLGARPTDPNTVEGAHHGFRKFLDRAAGVALGAATFNPVAGIGMYRMLNHAPLRQAQDKYDAQNERYQGDFENASKVHSAEVADDRVSAQLHQADTRRMSAEDRVTQKDKELDALKSDRDAKNNIAQQKVDNAKEWNTERVNNMNARTKIYQQDVSGKNSKRASDINHAGDLNSGKLLRAIELQEPGVVSEMHRLLGDMDKAKAAGDQQGYKKVAEQYDDVSAKYVKARDAAIKLSGSGAGGGTGNGGGDSKAANPFRNKQAAPANRFRKQQPTQTTQPNAGGFLLPGQTPNN